MQNCLQIIKDNILSQLFQGEHGTRRNHNHPRIIDPDKIPPPRMRVFHWANCRICRNGITSLHSDKVHIIGNHQKMQIMGRRGRNTPYSPMKRQDTMKTENYTHRIRCFFSRPQPWRQGKISKMTSKITKPYLNPATTKWKRNWIIFIDPTKMEFTQKTVANHMNCQRNAWFRRNQKVWKHSRRPQRLTSMIFCNWL